MKLFTPKHGLEYEDLLNCLKEDSKYDTIRVTEPDMFPRRSLPLIQFTKPIHGNFKIQHNKSIPQERFKDPKFSLRDFIFSDNKEATDQALKTLKNRSCNVNEQQLK